MAVKIITPIKAIQIFISFTAYFYLLLFTLLPFLKLYLHINSALYWFITGYFIFIPLFLYALNMVRHEGNNKINQILLSLNIKTFTKNDWAFAVVGLFLVFILTGLVFGISFLLNKYFGIRNLKTTPWFIELSPFQGIEKLLLLVWFPMFFFNIVGEEILWRGYIQTRLQGKYSWLLCSLLWFLFHLPFGIDLMIMLLPIIILIPYIFNKTRNTLVGIFIHGIYNGPLFVAIALGLMK